MSKEFPTSPDWKALGFPPKPAPDYGDDPRYPLPPDPSYEHDYKVWLGKLKPKQQEILNDYQSQVREWYQQAREDLKAIQQQEYEKYGLEMDVDSEHDLMVARNMAGLLDGIGRVRLAIEGQLANEQFEGFFHDR